MADSASSPRRLILRLSIFGVVVFAVIVSVMFFSSRVNTPPTYTGGKVVGKLVPDVTVTTMAGEKISLRSLIGKRVIVNFFNSWCMPCQEEMPALQEFARKHQDDPSFVFIGIVRVDSEKAIRAWAKSNNEPFVIAFDKDEAASIAFGTTGQPETYAINANGRVVASVRARVSTQSLDEIWDATE
ncbi:MAG TPA: TlpA disulfide reductase family protein [Acidimicrobiia bacterium]|nr:TlpA disulfide reductase family protein [Acidimicrobiia bacterium]